MRFAGDSLIQDVDNSLPGSKQNYQMLQDKPVVPGFNSEDLIDTPEMRPGPYFPGQDLMRDKYIRENPGSGVARLPNGEQGPVRGPHTPIKKYGGSYMPDGSAGSGGYRPGPMPV